MSRPVDAKEAKVKGPALQKESEVEVWEDGDDEDIATCKEVRPCDGQLVRDDTDFCGVIDTHADEAAAETPETEPAEATRNRASAARLNYLGVELPRWRSWDILRRFHIDLLEPF